MATINITKSGTLNPTLGRIDNDDATTTAYAAGDTLYPQSGATLRINTSTTARPPGTIQATATSGGTIDISNSSTTTPIVVQLNTENSDLYTTSAVGLLRVRGDWIIVATGTGAASQTIDFSNIGGVSIDYPVCVWVETGDSRHQWLPAGGALATGGYFMPFFNCAETTDALNINILTDYYGDNDHGPVFQFNKTTKIATFGKGGAVGSSLGGAIPGSGKRILYPNIHFTSTVFNATVSARNELMSGAGGKLDIQVAGFSPNFTIGRGPTGIYANGDTTLKHVCCTGPSLAVQNTLGTTTIQNFATGPDYSTLSNAVASVNCYITGPQGPLYVDQVWVLAKYNTANTYGLIFNNAQSAQFIGSLWGWISCTAASANLWPLQVQTTSGPASGAPLQYGPVYAIGGVFAVTTLTNMHLRELHLSNSVKAVADTTNLMYGFQGNLLVYHTVAKIRRLTNGVAPRQYLIYTDLNSHHYAIKDVVFDLQSNCSELARLGGTKGYLTNATGNNPRTTLIADARNGIKRLRQSNINSSAIAIQGTAPQGAHVEWAMQASSQGTAGSVDGSPFQLWWTATDKSAGKISIGPFRPDVNESHRTVVSGVSGTDFWDSQSTAFFIINAGTQVIFTGDRPLRGISSFGATPTWALSANAWSGVTVEFSMRLPRGDAAWTAWASATTVGNWQTALSSLDDYTDAEGFLLRVRLTATTTVSGRYFNYASITCTPNAAWTPAEIGFVDIGVSGQVNGTAAKLYVNTVPASPVAVSYQTLTAASTILEFPYDFDANPRDYKLKLRKAGYDESIVTGSVYMTGATVPVAQTLRVAVDEVAAAAMTGITIIGPEAFIALTESHSLAEIYAYAQWWAAQLGNLDYPVPITTSDGNTYSGVFDLTVFDGANITGVGSLNLGVRELVMDGAAQSSVDITHSGGAKVWTRIAVSGLVAGSRVRVYDSTSATELLNAVVAGTSTEVQKEWSADHTLDVRVAYCSGATAYLPFESAATFSSRGASVTASQAADTVYNTLAISGASCDGASGGEFTADFPDVWVDVSDSDNVTTFQRLYAWMVYTQSTASGITTMFDAITSADGINFMVDSTKVDLHLFNTKTTPLIISGGYLYRSDGATVIAATSNSIQLDPGKAYAARDLVNTATRLEKFARNKRITDPNTGSQIVYEDDGLTIFATGRIYEDIAAQQPYRGQGADRAERLA